MKRIAHVVLLILSASAANSQDAATITLRARAWLDTLTSPSFHGRGYVNDGQRIASDWIAKQFGRMGLQPVKQDFFEPFQFNVNCFPDSVLARIDGLSLVPGARVLCDFGKRQIMGVVIGLSEREPETGVAIKPLRSVIEATPVISAEMLGFLQEDWLYEICRTA